MEKLTINLNGSRDEILKEVKEIKEHISSFNITGNEMKKMCEMWTKTGKKSHWDSFTHYSMADMKISACKTYLLTTEVLVRNNVKAKDLLEKSINCFKKYYDAFVNLYEMAEEEAEKEE